MKHIARLLLSREFCARSAFSCALAALLAAPAAQASFLGDIAANPAKVASSPYATGGDVILALSANEYVHIFTNTTAAASFTPAQALNARLLLIGGGGGGGNKSNKPGGGGAGGMVEVAREALSADTAYAVAVGAGSVGTSQNRGTTAGDSSFVGGSVSYVAVGGGRGSDYATAGFMSGGSGGGAGSNNNAASGGAGTPGQGNDGGSVEKRATNNGGGSGGGGAGAPGGALCTYVGESPFGLHAGIGGDGLPSDILGFRQYFAGGGGGYSNMTADNGYVRAPGGLGGGGSGGIGGDPVGEDGEDGLGGGGGGVNGSKGTKGGDGIVIVRYVDPTFAAPSVADVAVSLASPRTAVVSGRLACVGTGASSATVTIDVWPTSDPSDVSTTALAANLSEGGSFSGMLAGLSRDTAYSWSLHAENDDSVPSTAVTGSFTTWSDSLAASSTGAETSTIGHDTVLVFTNATTGGKIGRAHV